ncbi:MAG: AAA family ATPase [Campylobacter sp.]|uniref:AAA family ATPase n=1 Tax=Campylobacter sp. TaxID=205 RepID=UPI002AA6178D|nr:AAA family ATPase [Campylobacter sp.]MCI7550052.1 AAA family ATPase [Campylobacter sp.]
MQINAQDLAEVLKGSKNIILHGAPGTGKTHLAKQIAEELGAEYEFVQFHPSYDYTDFIEGLRPVNENGQVVFKRKDGIFKEFCKDAIPFLNFDATKKENLEFEYSDEEIAIFKELRNRLKDIERRKEIAEKLKDIYKEFDKEKDKEYFSKKYEEYNTYDEDLKQFFLDLNEFYISIYDAKDTENTFIETYNKEYEMNFGKFVYCDKCDNKKQKESEGWRLFKNKKPETDGHGNTCGSKNNDDICKELIDVYKNKPFNDQRKYQRYIAETIINFFCQKRDKDVSIVDKFIKSTTFVFIIDEINRGEISKIFGELFYLIDPGKRGEDYKLPSQYQNLIENDDKFGNGFYIPDNVYIIATMNDIDRSAEPIDFAFRRRFTWINVKASDTEDIILNQLDEKLKEKAKIKMKNLNRAIIAIDGLDENYQIGASYFLKLLNYLTDEIDEVDEYKKEFNCLWEYHLEPLLREYLSGRAGQEIENELRKLKNEYDSQEVENNNG